MIIARVIFQKNKKSSKSKYRFSCALYNYKYGDFFVVQKKLFIMGL